MGQITDVGGVEKFNRELASNIQDYLELLDEIFQAYEFHFKIEGRWNGETVGEGYQLRVTGAFKDPMMREGYHEFIMLAVQLNYIDQQVQVKQIQQPVFMRETNAVMKILHILQHTAAQVGYGLFMEGASSVFFDYLVQRGCRPCAAETLEGEPLEAGNALFLPPSAQLLDASIHVQLADMIGRYNAGLERAYGEAGLRCPVSCAELENGNWLITVDGSYQINGSMKRDEFLMLRLLVDCRSREIDITNIFLPPFMRYRNTGKELIYRIFKIAEPELVQVFLVDMVPSFYRRMVNRGAQRCCRYIGQELAEASDIVRITRDTRLI